MNIKNFISNYKNHPVLFIGTGISLRYLKNSYTWDGLLKQVSFELTNNEEFYLDIKSRSEEKGKFKFEKIATLLEDEFKIRLEEDRNGKFKEVNDIFYKNMRDNLKISRFKIYIALLFSKLEYREEMSAEISELKKIRKNIGSIITTNYDKFIEEIFEFNPLIGNNILLSNPYGSVYKIHGCVTAPDKIIITEDDYVKFLEKYELIRAQLLSLFIHNPIIFMGYSISDENIKNILKTIFTYIEPSTEEAEKIRRNFLLVEYEKDSNSDEILEHDIDMEGFSTVRINKLKTDNFLPLYQALSNINLPISAMDVRKVQNIMKEIYSGGNIKVNITEDLDNLHNNEKILAIGTKKTIIYKHQNTSEMMSNYFKIIDEANVQVLSLIDDFKIQKQQFFPIYGFSTINKNIKNSDKLKKQQKEKLKSAFTYENNHKQIDNILNDESIATSHKENAIGSSVINNKINTEELKKYLIEYEDKEKTAYRKLLCAYDYKKYS